MMKMNRWMMAATLTATLGACAQSPDTGDKPDTIEVGDGDFTKGGDGRADSSVEAIFVDMTFSGYVLTNSSWNRNGQIEDQMLYTIGHLNGDNSIGRIDKLQLTNVTTSTEDGMTRIDYDAILPVAWGKRNNVPSEYTFKLPKDISSAGQNDFTEKYKDDCVDWSAHDVDRSSMWYYYRIGSSRCQLDDADIVTATASVSISEINTTGKYPEYDKIWEDDALKVVAIFGKYEDGATSTGDAGIAAYNRFVSKMKNELSGFEVTQTPNVTSPGVDNPEVVFAGDIAPGKSIQIVTLLVDNVRTAGYEFDRRYEELTRDGDLIVYSGHAGLGANIRAMAQKGDWQTGQYSVVFMNGCDTYAYVDSALNDAHADVNPDDATGTKYVDIVMNAMPAFFREVDRDTIALVKGLMSFDDPKTFEQIFRGIDPKQVVLVSGEEDNTYVPGGGGGGEVDENWAGMTESGSVARNEKKNYETPTLGAGTYDFDITGTGDADLYVRIGQAPTSSSFDCRPYKSGSSETCRIELTAPTKIFVMVNGYSTQSTFDLVGTKLGAAGGGDTISATNDETVSIPDNDANGAFSTVTIDENGTIAAVRVDVKITHTYRGDLTVLLTNGSEEVIVYRGSGSSDNVLISNEPVAGFEGRDVRGDWTLRVVDNASRDTGTIDTWTLHLDM